jgi:hypothetical protein
MVTKRKFHYKNSDITTHSKLSYIKNMKYIYIYTYIFYSIRQIFISLINKPYICVYQAKNEKVGRVVLVIVLEFGKPTAQT